MENVALSLMPRNSVHSKTCLRFIAALLLVVQVGALFYCGDPGCLHGKVEQPCKTVACGGESEDGRDARSPLAAEEACPCLCNVVAEVRLLPPMPVTRDSRPVTVSVIPSTPPVPAFPLDHIPRS